MNAVTPVAVGTQCTYRPARLEDMAGVHQLLAAIAALNPNYYAPNLEDIKRDFADPWCVPETDTRVAVAPGGAIIAYCRVLANPEPEDTLCAYLDDDVHPEQREPRAHHNQGLEEPLLDWLEARGAARLREIAAAHPTHTPPVMRLGCWDTEPGRRARYEQRSFRPVRYFYRMRRDLSQPIPDRPLPAGLTLHTYRPELDEQMRQTFNESFRDGWTFDTVTPSDWQQFFVQRSTFRSDLSFAIMEGEEVVAISVNRFDPVVAKRTGFKSGWIGSLGTRRAWRKRGLASALLVASMRAFQAAGLEYAGLGVDAQNPTGALGLYEGLGFAPYARSMVYQKNL
jgi:mycothiol synthase